MTSRDRVKAALDHSEPDSPPCDYFYTPEIQQAVERHFGLSGDDAMREALGTDIRYVIPPYVGPPLLEAGDGSITNIWGITKRPMPNRYGDYAEPVSFPYAGWTTVEQAEQFS